MEGSVRERLDPGHVRARGDGKSAVAVVVFTVGCEVMTGRFGYDIDGRRNPVSFRSAAGAAGRPTKGGALLVSGEFPFGGDTYKSRAIRVERAKPGGGMRR